MWKKVFKYLSDDGLNKRSWILSQTPDSKSDAPTASFNNLPISGTLWKYFRKHWPNLEDRTAELVKVRFITTFPYFIHQ